MKRQIILAGVNDRLVFTEGWYGLEKSPEGILYRASSAQATCKFSTSGKIRLTFLLSARPEHTGAPLAVHLKIGDQFIDSFELQVNPWTIRQSEFHLPDDTILTIVAQNPWSPDKIYRNGDARSLGILLSALILDSI